MFRGRLARLDRLPRWATTPSIRIAAHPIPWGLSFVVCILPLRLDSKAAGGEIFTLLGPKFLFTFGHPTLKLDHVRRCVNVSVGVLS